MADDASPNGLSTLIDDTLIDSVCAAAAASARRRKNHNFHRDNAQPGHRLLNALQSDSYIPPHRHLDPNKDETMVVVRGLMGLIEFDDAGTVLRAVKVGAGGTAIGVDIPFGSWHTVVALTDNTVFLEAKAGPYEILTDAERATWAPAEDHPSATGYLAQLRQHFAVR
jgi:cupin fold WbuC family metalloprotein